MAQIDKKNNLVLFVSGFPTAENTSRGIFNKRAAQNLSRTNNVTVIYSRMWRPWKKIVNHSDDEGFELYTIYVPNPFLNFLKGLQVKTFITVLSVVLKRVIKNADVLHSVGADDMGVITSGIAKKFGKGHITQLIGTDVNTVLPVSKDKWYVRGWERNLHGVSANSTVIKTEFLKLYPNLQVPVVTNYRGVNPDLFKPGIKSKDFLQILFVGGLSYDPLYKDNLKGGRTIMEVWRDIDKSGLAPYKLLFAGPDSDKPDVKEWKEKLEEKEKVEILGKLNPDTVRKHMSQSHLVLIPSYAEGTPNACFEAMASGCAVFGSNVGGIPELIDTKVNGMIMLPDDIKAWSDSIVWAMNNLDSVVEMGAKAREKALKVFDYRFYAERCNSLYEGAIKTVSEAK